MTWMNVDWGLNSELARQLYHETAASAPVIDFHNHLSAAEIAADQPFENLAKMWLDHDHYKWRMMRANGISEAYITGNAPDFEKFCAWATTLPYLLGSPLYQWTHLELARCFGIQTLLDGNTAKEIWDRTQTQLRDDPLTPQRWLARCRVKVLCTTDDPVDDLRGHQDCRNRISGFSVLPTFRPDRVFDLGNLNRWNRWVEQLASAAQVSINHLADLQLALDRRHQSFHDFGCRVSDHGLPVCWSLDADENRVEQIFQQARLGETVDSQQIQMFASWVLIFLARLDWQRGWTKQLHLGAKRNANSRLFADGGDDRGGDVMGEWPQLDSLSRFLDQLELEQRLPKMIIYNNHPQDNYPLAVLLGAFGDPAIAGKLQWGPAWWHLDHADGIRTHLRIMANVGLLGRAVGMTTDSRSYLSMVRHEYYRRVLCDWISAAVHGGEIPDELSLLTNTVEQICYRNARDYFGWLLPD